MGMGVPKGLEGGITSRVLNSKIFNGAFNGRSNGIAFSPNNRLFACVRESFVDLFDVTTGRLERTLEERSVLALAFSPNSRQILLAQDIICQLWDVATGLSVKQFKHHWHGVWAVAFSPDGCLVASGDLIGTVRLSEVGA